MKEEIIQKLRESARTINGWRLFRDDEKQELEQIVYKLNVLAIILKTYDDNDYKWVFIDLLQDILNILEYYSFDDFKDAVDKARVVKNLKDVMHLL